MAVNVNLEPLAAEARRVLALFLKSTAATYEWAVVLIFVFVIEGARVFNRDDDPARGISIAPHLVMIDADESVMEVVRAVVNRGDVADHYAPSVVDIDMAKGLDREWRKPISVEGRMHPIFLWNE